MKAIPVDVMKDVANKMRNLKTESKKLRIEARESLLIADRLELESNDMERLLAKWQDCFPETTKEY